MNFRDTADRKATNVVVNNIDFDAFTEAVRNELVPCADLTQCGLPYPSLYNDTSVGIDTKTMRAGYDCCDTEPVSAETMAVARDIANRFGLDVYWSAVEKGWGDFTFTEAK